MLAGCDWWILIRSVNNMYDWRKFSKRFCRCFVFQSRESTKTVVNAYEMNSSSSQRFFIFLSQTLQASCEDLTESMTIIPAIFLRRSAHTTPNESSLKEGLKRFTNDFAVLWPQVGFTYSSDVVCTIFFLRATSFCRFQFFLIGHTASCLSIFNLTLVHGSGFPRKVSYIFIGWHLTGRRSWMLVICILMRGRDEINNALAAGASPPPAPRACQFSPLPSLF